jgi:hypothetical protein
MCKTVCSVQYTTINLYVVHQCLSNSLKLFEYNLTDCLFRNFEKILQTGVRVACAQNRNVIAILTWTGITARNLVSLFTIFRPTKFISISKYVGAFRVNLLYRTLKSWHLKPANKPVPLYTHLFLYNTVCQQRFLRRFLLPDNMWCTNMTAALATCKDIFPPRAANTGGLQRAARSPEWSPCCPNLNLRASRTPCDDVTPLRSAEYPA